MLYTLLVMLVVGAIAGAVARLVIPRDGVSGILPTIALGVVGSFVGGFLGFLIFGKDMANGALQPSGLIGSILGAIIALLVYRAVTGRRTHAHA